MQHPGETTPNYTEAHTVYLFYKLVGQFWQLCICLAAVITNSLLCHGGRHFGESAGCQSNGFTSKHSEVGGASAATPAVSAAAI